MIENVRLLIGVHRARILSARVDTDTDATSFRLAFISAA